jgi:hypothetical protein
MQSDYLSEHACGDVIAVSPDIAGYISGKDAGGEGGRPTRPTNLYLVDGMPPRGRPEPEFEDHEGSGVAPRAMMTA